jgi:hypothetical protein
MITGINQENNYNKFIKVNLYCCLHGRSVAQMSTNDDKTNDSSVIVALLSEITALVSANHEMLKEINGTLVEINDKMRKMLISVNH